MPRSASSATLALKSPLKFLRLLSLITCSFFQQATILIHCPEIGVHYNHGWLFIALTGFYPIFLLGVGKEIYKRAETNGLNVEGLLALINSLDQIVGYKNNRFTNHSKNVDGLTKEKAFCEITQPKTQIEEIVRSICGFFNATQTKKTKSLIRVTLAEIQDGRVASVPLFFPSDEPLRASLADLNNSKSAILIAAKEREMVLIEDIKKELQKPVRKRRYFDTGNDQDNSGSIICYPVYHAKNTAYPYVISIHSNEPRYFKNEFKQLYEHSLQRFALRLSVEPGGAARDIRREAASIKTRVKEETKIFGDASIINGGRREK